MRRRCDSGHDRDAVAWPAGAPASSTLDETIEAIEAAIP